MNGMTAMLTTIDNPFNPFEDWDHWLAYDISHGHNCCGQVDRFAITSDSLSDSDNQLEIERAIDEIVSENVTGMYRKVVKD